MKTIFPTTINRCVAAVARVDAVQWPGLRCLDTTTDLHTGIQARLLVQHYTEIAAQ